MNDELPSLLSELESHVAEAGWDQPPALFALVDTEDLLRAEPGLAASLGLVAGRPGQLTPVQQEPLGDAPLDEALSSLVFGPGVLGVALVHEVLVLPPGAEAALAGEDDPVLVASTHPARREVRMAVAVLRGGGRAVLLRLRGGDGTPDDLVTGTDLAPALAEALLATLE